MLKPNAQNGGLAWSSIVGATVFFAFGMLALGLRLSGADVPPPGAGDVLSAVALAAFYVCPGILVVVSATRRSLLLAAGALGLASIVTSMSITPLLIIPSVLVFVGYRSTRPAPPRVPAAIIVIVTLVLAAGAFALLITGTEARCWTYTTDTAGRTVYAVRPASAGHLHVPPLGPGGPTGSGCANDVTPLLHSVGALAILGLLAAGAVVMATPRRGGTGFSGSTAAFSLR